MKNKKQSSEAEKIKEIKNFYDGVYYANKSSELRLSKHYFRLVEKLKLQPGQKILDVACGSGEWLKICELSGLSVSGVDLSEKAIDICKENMPLGFFYSQSAEHLPFEDNSFDVITCLGSLEHFVNPVQSLKEMVRVASLDAVYLILVPNKDFLTRKIGLFCGTFQVDAKEEVRTLDGWNEIFVTSGLEVQSRWKDLHVLNWNWISTGKTIMWPFRAIQALLLIVWPLKWQYQVYHQCIMKEVSKFDSTE